MSGFNTTGFMFLPMLLPAVFRFGRRGAGMSDPAPKLKLTQVDPVDELAPIPIATGRQRLDPFCEKGRLDPIRRGCPRTRDPGVQQAQGFCRGFHLRRQRSRSRRLNRDASAAECVFRGADTLRHRADSPHLHSSYSRRLAGEHGSLMRRPSPARARCPPRIRTDSRTRGFTL